MSGYESVKILGVRVDKVTKVQALAEFEKLLSGSRCELIVTPNAEIVEKASKTPKLRQIVNEEAALVIPDGVGLIYASKLKGDPIEEKVAGIDFARNMLSVFARRGTRLYLLGSKPGVAEQAAEKMKELAPGLVICGTADGYFREEAPVIEKINEAGAEALFVCLGAPKQEKFMFAHQNELPTVRLMAGLGGSLDGFAGNVKRAPDWMIQANLEWFYRLCKEPRRIGRMMRLPKYLIKATGNRQQATGNRK